MIYEPDYDEPVYVFLDPWVELNLGLWFLFAGATLFLVLRIYFKITRRHRLWWDDYILLVCWVILLANDSLIIAEFANGYVLPNSYYDWGQPMRLLITISSCGTLIGQAWTKTAFGATLLRMSNRWQRWILWFCIVTLNIYMFVKVLLQWAKVCGDEDYDVYWRLNFCLEDGPRDNMKEGGNVYNIIMDFVFACFPWLITRELKISRKEKVGLCATMSLGMVVAIVSAIRVAWKDYGNERNSEYIFRNGLSQVWYSSEICGTIIVQCIPILRPIVKEYQDSRASNRLASKTTGSKMSSAKRMSNTLDSRGDPAIGLDKQRHMHIALREIPEEPAESQGRVSFSSDDDGYDPRPGTASIPDTFLQSDSEESGINVASHSRKTSRNKRPQSAISSVDIDVEAGRPTRGLSLPRHGGDV